MKDKLQKILVLMLPVLLNNVSVYAEYVPAGFMSRIEYVIGKFGPMPTMMTAGIVLLAIMIIVTVVYYNKNWRKKR